MKRIWKAYFSFSCKEKKAIVVLLFLIGCFLAAPYFFPEPPKKIDVPRELVEYVRQAESASVSKQATGGYSVSLPPGSTTRKKPVLFFFNPNRIDEAGWRKLGLAEKTIRTLLHYRAKGGSFRTPADIRKIWGLPGEIADQLIPYIRITEPVAGVRPPNRDIVIGQPRSFRQSTMVIDINQATADDWKTLPGIGDVLAKRIVAFRKKLGGFQRPEQLRQTYGLPDSVFRRILPFLQSGSVYHSLLDLNTVSAGELENIAGISASIATAIIAYRKQYGRFQSVEDLRKVIFVNDSVFRLLKPFLQTVRTY